MVCKSTRTNQSTDAVILRTPLAPVKLGAVIAVSALLLTACVPLPPAPIPGPGPMPGPGPLRAPLSSGSEPPSYYNQHFVVTDTVPLAGA